MFSRLARPLPVIWLVVIAAISAMAVVGWVIASTSNGPGQQRFAVSVINDRDTSVTIQPCARFFCNKLQPVDLAAGNSHTWQTSNGDAGVRSFVVEAVPSVRVLGCLAQHGLSPVGESAVVRVSELEKCVA